MKFLVLAIVMLSSCLCLCAQRQANAEGLSLDEIGTQGKIRPTTLLRTFTREKVLLERGNSFLAGSFTYAKACSPHQSSPLNCMQRFSQYTVPLMLGHRFSPDVALEAGAYASVTRLRSFYNPMFPDDLPANVAGFSRQQDLTFGLMAGVSVAVIDRLDFKMRFRTGRSPLSNDWGQMQTGFSFSF